MYKLAVLLATSLFALACSDPSPSLVDCGRSPQAGDTSVNCGDNDSITNGEPVSAGSVALAAGCYQDIATCPQAFPGSWLMEHCTIPYVCPARNADGGTEERICLRFVEQECWDKYSN